MKACKNCSKGFEVTESDLVFYGRIGVPEPTLCPDCRQQRRIVYRNERKFYHRKCDLTGRDMISIYSPEKKCKVYSQDAWWSDDWDGTDYGRDFDFGRPFFEQFLELSKEVPRIAVINMSSENSNYTNHAAYNKNCYMCVNTGYSEDCYYITNYCLYNKNCTDCLAIQRCELCYFCVDSQSCYNSQFLIECGNCIDSKFCYDCKNCKNCFGCWNLRNADYCIFNKQYSKEEYERHLSEMKLDDWNDLMGYFEKLLVMMRDEAAHKALRIINCEDCTGDHLNDDQHVHNSFYTFGSQDCAYCYDAGELKDCYDATEPFKGELEYETHACNINYDVMFASKSYENSHLRYCQYCWYSENLFGCFGLKRKKYCVLNKQYTKEEYEALVPRIIEHMKSTGEWGEFFPTEDSPFDYNETIAQEYYPMSKEGAEAKGYGWKENENVAQAKAEHAMDCGACGKQFLVIPQEQAFYDRLGLPRPGACFECRHKMRFDLRPPRKFVERSCAGCGKAVKSVFAEGMARNVLCEACYLEKMY